DSPRALPLMAALDNNNVIVTGGFASPPSGGNRVEASSSDASSVTELIQINNGAGVAVPMADANLTDKRGRGGIVSLGEGRVLVGGGAFRSGGETTSTGTAE